MASSMPKDLSNLVNDFRGDPAEQLSLAVCGTRDVNDPNYIGTKQALPSGDTDKWITINNVRVKVYFLWHLPEPTYGILHRAPRMYHEDDPVCKQLCSEPEYDEDYPEEVFFENDKPYVNVHIRLNRPAQDIDPLTTVPMLPEQTIARLERRRGSPLPTNLRYDYHRVVKDLYNEHKSCAPCAVPGCECIGEENLAGFCRNCASSVNFPACRVCGLAFGFMKNGTHAACCEEC